MIPRFPLLKAILDWPAFTYGYRGARLIMAALFSAATWWFFLSWVFSCLP